MWIHPLVQERTAAGAFYTLFQRLRADEAKFFNYFRMSVASFDNLLGRIRNQICKQDSNMRPAIPPEEMLAVTLR